MVGVGKNLWTHKWDMGIIRCTVSILWLCVMICCGYLSLFGELQPEESIGFREENYDSIMSFMMMRTRRAILFDH